jgi:8-oxo-dGTP pyrophosphatase MutT (NUDIX family)
MPHIHTNPGDHDHTASAYIFRTDMDEPVLLLHKHMKLKRYIQFGGHIEVSETPWQAVRHEILEESGYDIKQLKILQPKQRLRELHGAVLHPVPVFHNTHQFDSEHLHTDLGYAFTTDSEPAKPVAYGESGDIITVTRSELAALPPEQIYEPVREGGLFIFKFCLPEWEAVDPKSFE